LLDSAEQLEFNIPITNVILRIFAVSDIIEPIQGINELVLHLQYGFTNSVLYVCSVAAFDVGPSANALCWKDDNNRIVVSSRSGSLLEIEALS